MEFGDVVRSRRMVRAYDADRPVARSQLDALLDLARRAPSAGNSQGWHFLVLDEPPSCAAYWEATTDPTRAADRWLRSMRTAPALIVVFSDRARYQRRYGESDKSGARDVDLDARWTVPYWHVDAGGAALLLLLGAVDFGLGACLFGVPPARVADLRATFAVPDDLVPVGVVSLGHPAPVDPVPGSGRRRPRRPAEQVVHYGRFDTTAPHVE